MRRICTFVAITTFALSLLVPLPSTPYSVLHAAGRSAHTPAKNSRERRAIMDALRKHVKNAFGLRVIFTVKHLKVKNGWAFMRTIPTSPDGKVPFEPMAALLKSNSGRWGVAAVVTGTDLPVAVTKLRRKYGGAPPEIFR